MKKVLSILVVACFVLAMLPMSALAVVSSVVFTDDDSANTLLAVGETREILATSAASTFTTSAFAKATTGSGDLTIDDVTVGSPASTVTADLIGDTADTSVPVVVTADDAAADDPEDLDVTVVDPDEDEYAFLPLDTLNGVIYNASEPYPALYGTGANSGNATVPLLDATLQTQANTATTSVIYRMESLDSTGGTTHTTLGTTNADEVIFSNTPGTNDIFSFTATLRETADTSTIYMSDYDYELMTSGTTTAYDLGDDITISDNLPVVRALQDVATDNNVVPGDNLVIRSLHSDDTTVATVGFNTAAGGNQYSLRVTPAGVGTAKITATFDNGTGVLYTSTVDVNVTSGPTGTFDPQVASTYESSNDDINNVDPNQVTNPNLNNVFGENNGLFWVFDSGSNTLGIFPTLLGDGKMDTTKVGKAPWISDKDDIVNGDKIINVYIAPGVVNIGKNYFSDNSSRSNYPDIEDVYVDYTSGDYITFDESSFQNSEVMNVWAYVYYDPITGSYVEDGDGFVGAVGDLAFKDCNYLEEFYLIITGDIGDSAFEACSSLLEVTIDDSTVKEIGEYAFYNCVDLGSSDDHDGLTILDIGSALKTIGTYAFAGTEYMETIDLPDSVNDIGAFAFAESGLTEIDIPGSLVTIPEGAFALCEDLETITFADTNRLRTIDAGAFELCTALESVEIPASVRYIGDEAFFGCDALAEVDLESADYLQTIGSYAFAATAIDNAVVIPSRVNSIGTYAFADIATLNTVEFMGRNADFDPATSFSGTSPRLVLVGAANAWVTIADAAEGKIPYYVSKDLDKDNGWFEHNRTGYWMFYDGGSLLKNQQLDFIFDPVEDSITFLLDSSGYSVENTAVLMSYDPDVWSYFDVNGIMVRLDKAADGFFYDENGERVLSGKVVARDGKIYVVDGEGNLLTNQEFTDETGTYYLGSDGAAVVDQFVDFTDEDGNLLYTSYYGADAKKVFNQKVDVANEDGTTDSYYMDAEGKMVKNGLVPVTETDADGNTVEYTAFFGADGKMVKNAEVAFTAEDGTVTYKRFDENGHMVTGFFETADGFVYYDPTTGDKVFGWVQLTTDPTTWAYTDPTTGIQQFGWVVDDQDRTFYMDPETGIMVEGWLHVVTAGEAGAEEDAWYFFNFGSGIMQKDTWVKSGDFWYYQQTDGTSVLGDWVQWNGYWYYCLPTSGRMATGWALVGEDYYFFCPDPTGDGHVNGAMETGWINYNNNWFYTASNGKCVYGWQEIGGNWFYFIPDAQSGRMVTGQYEINGVVQQFAGNGVWQGPAA